VSVHKANFLILAVLVSLMLAPQTAAGDDFQTRCNAAGVILCDGFDNPSAVANGLGADCNGTMQGSFDSTTPAEGAGSLKFNVPANANCGNMSGFIRRMFPQRFGENSVFYVQYRVRFGTDWVNRNWYNGWKLSIIHMDGVSCGGVELTTVDEYNRGFPQMYSDCGAIHMETDLGNGDFLLEQGDYNCHYQSRVSTTCAAFATPLTQHPNEWLTFYYKISLGNWNQPNTNIEAWMAYEGGAMKKFIEWTGTLLPNNTSSDNFNAIDLTDYATGLSGATNPQTAVWYDSLIVSTQPIAAPGGSSLPPPSLCDVNGDGSTNVADVQSEVNMALGINPCTNVSGTCTVVSVQRVVNAALGGTCVIP